MFFTFPEDARWNAEQQAVEFGVEIGEYRGWSGPAARIPTPVAATANPRAVRRGLSLQRTRFGRSGP
jgi:hypothetical protein